MRERGKGMQNCQPHVHRQAGELTSAQWKSGADISVKKHLVLQVTSCNAVIPIAGIGRHFYCCSTTRRCSGINRVSHQGRMCPSPTTLLEVRIGRNAQELTFVLLVFLQFVSSEIIMFI